VIYLDHNASTPVDPEVADYIHAILKSDFGNPSSSHDAGLRSRKSIETARSQVAGLIGASADEITFTSGGTESNNLAIIGSLQTGKRGHIITSAIEHPSVINPCRHLEGAGLECTYVGVDNQGRVAIEDVRKAVRKDTVLITIMHANNETGVLQPIEEIAVLARERGIVFHTDAAQTVGKIPVTVRDLNIDMMTIVSHKFHGPKGVGALYIKKGIELSPILFGAGHERGLRPGTENVPGIGGLGKACEIAALHTRKRASRLKEITDVLFLDLKTRIDGLKLNGHETLRLPNTLNVCIPGVDSSDLIEEVKDKVAASAGSACHAGQKEPSPVLKAMGISDRDVMSSIRLSTGKDTMEEEIKEAAEIIAATVRHMRR
jgi:cysteine desulfurase